MSIRTINSSSELSCAGDSVVSRTTEAAARLGRRLLLWARSDGARMLPFFPWCVAKAGWAAYDMYHLVQAALNYPNSLEVKGLDPIVAQKLYKELEENIASMDWEIPLQPVRFKKNIVIRLVTKAMQQIDEKHLEKITVADVEHVFQSGLTATLLQAVGRGVDGFVEKELERVISILTGTLGGLSFRGGRLLKRLNVINIPNGKFLFEVNRSPENTYTVKLLSGEGVNSDTLLDGMQELHEVCLYEGVSEEKLCGLKDFLHNFEDEHRLAYALKDVPELLATYFGVPIRVDRLGTLDNGMFTDEGLLRIVRQQIVDEAFGGDALEADKLLFSIRIAELATYFLQNEKKLSVKISTLLLERVRALHTELSASYDFPEKEGHIDTLTHLSFRIRRQLLKALATKETAGKQGEESIIPPCMRPLFDMIFSTLGTSSVLTQNIIEGVRRALGKDFSALIEAARADYLAHGGLVQEGDKESISLKSYAGIILICGFVQYILFDLLVVAGVTVIGSSSAAGITSMALAAIISAELYELIPEEQRKTYVRMKDTVMYCMLPLIIEWGYRLFVSEEVKKEVEWRIQVIDACSFRSTVSKKSDAALEEEVIDEIGKLPEDPREVIDRLKASNEAFCERLTREIQEAPQSEMIEKPPLSYLSVIERRIAPAADVYDSDVDTEVAVSEYTVEEGSDDERDAAGVGGSTSYSASEAEVPESAWARNLQATTEEQIIEHAESIGLVETVDSIEAMQEQLRIWEDIMRVFPLLGDSRIAGLLQSVFSRYQDLEPEFAPEEERQHFVVTVVESKQAASKLVGYIKEKIPKVERPVNTRPVHVESIREEPAIPARRSPRREIHPPQPSRREAAVANHEPEPPSSEVVRALDGLTREAMGRVEQVSRIDTAIRRSVRRPFTRKVRGVEGPALIDGPSSTEYWDEPTGTLVPSEATLMEAYTRIIQIGAAFHPPAAPSSPEELFAYFQGIEEVFKLQMSIIRSFSEREIANLLMYRSCMGAIQDRLMTSLQEIEPLFSGIEDPLFNERWSKEETNELCRAVRIVSEMYAATSRFRDSEFQVDPRGWLYQGALLLLTEQLLQREESTYKNAYLYLQPLCLIQQYGCLSLFSPRDRTLYTKLIEIHAESLASETDYIDRSKRLMELLKDSWWVSLYSEETDGHPMHIAKQRPKLLSNIGWYLNPPAVIIRRLGGRAKQGWGQSLPIIGGIADVWSSRWKPWLEQRKTFLPQPLHDLCCAISAFPRLYDISSSKRSVKMGYGTGRIDQASSIYAEEERRERGGSGTLAAATPYLFDNVVIALETLGRLGVDGDDVAVSNMLELIYFDWDRFEERASRDSKLCERLLRAYLMLHGARNRVEDNLFAFTLEIARRNHPQIDGNLLREVEAKIHPRRHIAARFFHLARQERLTVAETEQLHAYAGILIGKRSFFYTPGVVNTLLYKIYPAYVEKIRDPQFCRRVIKELLSYMPEHTDILLDEYVITTFSPPLATLTGKDGGVVTIDLANMTVKKPELPRESIRRADALPASRVLHTHTCLEDSSLTASFLRGAEGVLSLSIFRDKKVIFERECPSNTSQRGILIAKEPYFLPFLREFPRPPPLVYAFARGKELTCYQAEDKQLVYAVSSKEGGRVLFLQKEGGDLTCLTHGEMVVSDDQSIRGARCIEPYIVLERNGHRSAITAIKPAVASVIPVLGERILGDVWSNIEKTMALVPELSSLLSRFALPGEVSGFTLFALDKEGYLEPQSTEEYATVLCASLLKKDGFFSRHIQKLIHQIDVQEPPPGNLSLTDLCCVLGVAQIMNKTSIETVPLMLQLLLVQIQAIEFASISKEERFEHMQLLACAIPIYVSYIELGLRDVAPIPETTEVTFLHEAFTAFEQAINGEKDSGLLRALGGVLQEGIKPLFFWLFSSDMAKRLEYLDAKYPKPDTPPLGDFLKHLASSMLTKEPHFPLLQKVLAAPRRFMSRLIQQAAFRELEGGAAWFRQKGWYGESVPEALQDIAYESLDNEGAAKYMALLAAILTDQCILGDREEREAIKARLMHRLQTVVTPNAADYRPLRVLQYISNQVREGSVPQFTVNLSLKEYVHKVERKVWSAEESKGGIIGRAGAQLKALTKQYVKLDMTTIVCGSAAIAGIPSSVSLGLGLSLLGVEIVDRIEDGFAIRQGVARPPGAYPKLRHIIAEHTFLQRAFESLGEKHFTRGEVPGEAPYELRLGRADAYTEERVGASFEELRAQSGEITTYMARTSKEALREEIGQFDKAFRAHVETMRSDICAMVNKLAICPIAIDELFAYAIERDGALRLQSRLTCSLSVAECIMGRMVYLALYESYLVKTRLVLEAIDRGEELTRISHTHGKDDRTDVDDLSRECEKYGLSAVGAILFDTKHYEISEASDERYVVGCLIFEARSGMWLRPLQAKQMESALSEGDESVVVEMIPGSGKTAFAAILSLHYKWKPGEVALAVFTKELVASTKGEVAKRYFQLTGRSAFFLSIDRTKEDHISLQRILRRCESSKANGDILITSKEDMQALELLFVETLHTLSSKIASSSEYRAASRKFPYLQKILRCISEAHMVVDECHETLRPDELEVYPIGEEVAIDKTHIFGAELVFKHIVQRLRRKRKKVADFVEDQVLFNDVMREVVSAVASDRFFIVSPEQREELKTYFSEKEQEPPMWLSTHARFTVAAMVRGVCMELLPLKAGPSGDEEKSHATYGRASDSARTKYAIPYAGNGKPIDDAIFQSPHETLVKTYLFYLQTGLSKQEVQELRAACAAQAQEEAKAMGILIEETSMMRYYADHFGDIDAPQRALMHNQEAILLYVTLCIGPTIQYYPTSMESTSMDFAAMAKKAEYLSGTIYNKSVYPVGLRYCRSEETTAQTLSAVGKSIREGAGGVTTLPSEDSRRAFITQVAGDADCMMAIDAGALFNGVPNREVARKLAEACKESRPEIKAIVFFESDDTMWVREIESGNVARYAPKAFKPEERLCYLDQTHTFGVDIPQKWRAGAHITIGRNILAQIEQASWRLRGLASMGQYVRLTLLPEAQRDMDEMELPKTFEGTVQYLLTAEQNKLKRHTLQATLHAIRSTVRSAITRKLSEAGDLGRALWLFKEFEDLFVVTSSFSPISLYASAREKVDTKQYIRERIAHFGERVTKSCVFSEEEKRNIFEAFTALRPEILHETMHVDRGRGDIHFGGVRVKQKMGQRVQQREKHKEKTSLSLSPPPARRKPSEFRPWPEITLATMDWMYIQEDGSHSGAPPLARVQRGIKGAIGSMPCASITRVAQSFTLPHWHTFAKFFSDELLVTANVFPMEETGWTLSSLKDWFMRDSMEKGASKMVMDVLFIWNKESRERTIIGLGCADALVWEIMLKEKKSEGNLCYALCKAADGTLLDEAKIEPELRAFIESEEGKRCLLMWKIFNCDSPATVEERERLGLLCQSVIDKGVRIEELIEAVREIATIRQPDMQGAQRFTACIEQLCGQSAPSTLLYSNNLKN